jgi:hypothetical protein
MGDIRLTSYEFAGETYTPPAVTPQTEAEELRAELERLRRWVVQARRVHASMPGGQHKRTLGCVLDGMDSKAIC